MRCLHGSGYEQRKTKKIPKISDLNESGGDPKWLSQPFLIMILSLATTHLSFPDF